jgi:transposase IS481 family protein
MNVHKNARSCPASREELDKRVCALGWSVRAASAAAGMSDRRGREWMRRAEAGETLTDRSSRPHSTPSTDVRTRRRILTL